MATPGKQPYAAALAVCLVALLGSSIAGYRYYAAKNRVFESEARNRLAAIANMKAVDVRGWRRQRLWEGRLISSDFFIGLAARQFMSGGRNQDVVRTWMARLLSGEPYQRLILWDKEARPRLSLPAGVPVDSHESVLVREAMQSGLPTLTDLHRDPSTRAIHLALIAPLSTGRSATPVGALLLRIDPYDFLFPMVRSWPVPARTAEILLVRREGDEVVLLNDSRYRKDTALGMRLPLAGSRSVEALAGLGREGAVDGADYRGVPTVAGIRRVADTSWYVLAKMDAAEAYAPLQTQSALIVLAVCLLAVALGFAGLLVWHWQRSRLYRQRFEAEVERRALTGHYEYLSRYANDIVLLIDETGRIVEANDRAASSHGYSREELLKMNALDLQDPGERGKFPERWAAGRNAEGLLFETEHWRKDGSRFPVEVSARTFKIDGREYGQAIIRDITERKRADEALCRSEERFRQVAENASDFIWEVDANGLYTYTSPAVEKFLGYAPDEIIGKLHFYDLFAPDVREQLKATAFTAFARKEAFRAFPNLNVRKDGRPVALETSGVPVLDETGNLTGYRGADTDITERKRAEEALRATQEYYRRLIEQAADGILLLDQEGRFLLANSRLCEMLGYTEEEMRQLNILDTYLPHQRDAGQQRLSTIQSGTSLSFERLMRRKGGTALPVEISAIRLADGKMQAIVRDITERKRAEEERARLEERLQEAQRMESVGRLAGGVAHDFNNLLTVINGYSDLVLERMGEGNPLRDSLAEIRKAGGRAADLTHQLLAFSRKQVTAPRPLDLNRLVDESREMLRSLLGENIRLVTTLTPALWQVLADHGQLHRVVMNLAVNARDAMPTGGVLTIETANVELDESYVAAHPEIQPGCYVLLAVSDTGVGMAEEIRQHVFEPFFTTKAEGKGTGLGLSTVYGIVRQCGGWIWVYSELGQGTAFKIYLPRTESRAVNGKVSTLGPGALAGTETILVVEDQDDVRRLAVEVLRSHGYRVLEAATGGDALLVAGGHAGPIHLTLTDVVMPGMTGTELVERLRPLRPQTRVLYMSGCTANLMADRGVLDSDVNYISKPFSPAALASKVREVLGPPRTAVTVLVVDDEEGVRNLFQQVLMNAGYEVRLAGNGKQALEMLRENRFDVVLTDLVMPESEGIETIQAIRKGHPGLKIIAISGAFGGMFLEPARALGANATLVKPVAPGQLLAAVREVLGTDKTAQ